MGAMCFEYVTSSDGGDDCAPASAGSRTRIAGTAHLETALAMLIAGDSLQHATVR
jgi:hypothetical protein